MFKAFDNIKECRYMMMFKNIFDTKLSIVVHFKKAILLNLATYTSQKIHEVCNLGNTL
jgi:hypothetical protein